MKAFLILVGAAAAILTVSWLTNLQTAGDKAREVAIQDTDFQRHMAQQQQAEARLQEAIKTKSLYEGLTYEEARRVMGQIHWQSESDGAGGKVTRYYANDGSFTTTLHFVNGRLARWARVSNY
jgi:type II secretory pathway pseudopilin PulG